MDMHKQPPTGKLFDLKSNQNRFSGEATLPLADICAPTKETTRKTLIELRHDLGLSRGHMGVLQKPIADLNNLSANVLKLAVTMRAANTFEQIAIFFRPEIFSAKNFSAENFSAEKFPAKNFNLSRGVWGRQGPPS